LLAEGSHRKQRAALFRRAKLEHRVASIDDLVAQAKSVGGTTLSILAILRLAANLNWVGSRLPHQEEFKRKM
jgi:hypothetical protein